MNIFQGITRDISSFTKYEIDKENMVCTNQWNNMRKRFFFGKELIKIIIGIFEVSLSEILRTVYLLELYSNTSHKIEISKNPLNFYII